MRTVYSPPSDLPDEIRGVAKKQGIEFYPAYFDPAVERLVKFLGNFGVSRKTTQHPSVSPRARSKPSPP
ncbi:MAG UNVERIFIED_CONTAM: hypothetical protein LVT10_22255 [Anaerolineae bacterium]